MISERSILARFTDELILKYEDGIYMSYCIIGTALCSKNLDVSIYSVNLLSLLYENVGLNVPWFTKMGINSFIFAFIKHNNQVSFFINSMSDFIKSNEAIFFQELKNSINSDSEYKTLMFDLFPSLIPSLTKINNVKFKTDFFNFLFNLCIHEESKLSYTCSIICETLLLKLSISFFKLGKILVKLFISFFIS